MKIIGRVGSDYIVQASRLELNNISGCDNYNVPKLPGAVPNTAHPDYWKEGTEINVVNSFNLIFKYQQHHAQLEAAALNMKNVVKAITDDLENKLYPITKDGKIVNIPKIEVSTRGKKAKRIETQGQLEFIS